MGIFERLLSKETAPSDEESDDIGVSAIEKNKIEQMQGTILLLRQQLEAMRIDKEQSVRRAANAGKSEIAQLNDTVKALRDKLEVARRDKERCVQAATTANSDEIAQLKNSVVALRVALEIQKHPAGHIDQEISQGSS